MSKYLKTILAVCLFAVTCEAQQYAFLNTDKFTAAANGKTVRAIGTAYTVVRLSWSVSGGTLSVCSAKIQTSSDGASWSDLGSSTVTCTSNGTGNFLPSTANYVRTVLSSATGTATLTATLVGWMTTPGSVTTGAGAPVGACSPDGSQYLDTTGGVLYACKGGAWIAIGPGAAGSAAFNTLTGGTNTAQALVVGNGSTLATTGTGTITATTAGSATSATTAGNLTGTPALPNGTTATTQAAADNTTKLATDAFVQANAVTGSGTTNVIPKMTGAKVVGDSSITDDGTRVSTAEPIRITGSPNADIINNGGAGLQLGYTTTVVTPASISVGGVGAGDGAVIMKGTSSGSAAIKVNDAAGTPSTWKMPTTDPTNGQALTAGAPGAGVVQLGWTTITGGGGGTSPINPKTATYQVLAGDFSSTKTISVASGTFTITLVAAGTQPPNGQFIDVQNYGSGTVTVAVSGQNLNGGVTSIVMPPGSAACPSSLRVVSDGTDYFGTYLVSVTCANTPTLPSTSGNTIIPTYNDASPSALGTATAGTVVGLFSTCSGTQYLGADGACHNASGTIGGSTGGTDKALIGANGTGGSTIQASGITYDSSNNIHTPGYGSFGEGATTAGGMDLKQGTDNGAPAANTIRVQAPTSVTAYKIVKPTAACSGGLTWTNSSSTVTETCVTFVQLPVASGTSSLGTSAISSGACATAVTTSATGALTTDNLVADFSADPTGVTGYSPTSNGILSIFKYLTADNVNFKVCNNTGGSITPGAITLRWRVIR